MCTIEKHSQSTTHPLESSKYVLSRKDSHQWEEMKASERIESEKNQETTVEELGDKMCSLMKDTNQTEQNDAKGDQENIQRSVAEDKKETITSLTSKGKFRRHKGRSSPPRSEEEEENQDRRRKKRKLAVENEEGETRRRLKCPYFLRNPEKYRRGSCRGEGFADMGKLKDHLKRVHQRPLQCPRCWKEMPSEDAFAAHLKADPLCAEQPEPEDDRISTSKLRELNFSRVPYANKSVEDKWRRLYSDLFPDEYVPSPYEEYGLSPDFDILLAERLEREFAGAFSSLIEQSSREALHEKLLAMIKECRTGRRCFRAEGPEQSGSEPTGTTAAVDPGGLHNADGAG